jgi:ubiquinone/menaquinone biosynthesis C-methylase UbiE
MMENCPEKSFKEAFQWSLQPSKDVSLAVNSLKFWEELRKYLGDNKTIIDLGCGAGVLLYHIYKETQNYNNCRVMGFDFTEEAISLASKLCPQVEFKKGDVLNTQFPDNTFDIVCSCMVIEHVDDDKFLAEISRITKPGGTIFLTTVLKTKWGWYYLKNSKGESVLNLTHLREYRNTDEIARKIMKYGFNIVTLETPRIRFSLFDFLLMRLAALLRMRYFLKVAADGFVVKLRKMFKVAIPGYYAIEIVAQKTGKA